MENSDNPLPSVETIREIAIKRLKIRSDRMVPCELLRSTTLDVVVDDLVDALVFSIQSELMSNRVSTHVRRYVTTPLTWWDHFKRDVVPDRLRRWLKLSVGEQTIPVRIEHVHVCPHLALASQRDHLVYLAATTCTRVCAET